MMEEVGGWLLREGLKCTYALVVRMWRTPIVPERGEYYYHPLFWRIF